MPGSAATAAPPRPTLVIDAELQNQYAYEVLIYDQTRARQLVAAIEIVSPANKDRPENRRAFVTNCAALLQQGVYRVAHRSGDDSAVQIVLRSACFV
jgi:hypothetical protein